MWEIIANPAEYGVDVLEEGINQKEVFAEEDRKRWAEEIGIFAKKISALSEKAKNLQELFAGEDEILATPQALKTLKVQLFNINDSMSSAFQLADRIEKEIIKKV